MRILVADDTGSLAATCIVFLAYWGHEVEIAQDGLAALRRARVWHPHVILSRVALPVMDGLTLAAATRADPRLGDVAVVLAGPPDDFARMRARDLGVTGYLATPLVVAELQQLMNRLSEAHQPAATRVRRRGVA
ncbi:MAG TPA: response regulator [Anaeromyxobacteraceae bacterium]